MTNSSGSTGGRQAGKAAKSTDSEAVAGRPVAKPKNVVRVSSPSDPFEREADKMAHRVMQLTEPNLGLAPSDGGAGQRGGSAGGASGGSGTVSRSATGSDIGGGSVDRADVAPQGSGHSLDPGVRSWAGRALGADFSQVRVHTDDAAATAASNIGAGAYTLGNDIVFGRGRYQPDTPAGQHLLAHELTHVKQHRSAGRESEQVHRWVDLGSESWSGPPIFGNRHLRVWTGTKQEWLSVLDNMDDEDEYRARLQGFLEVSNDPSIVNRTATPRSVSRYMRTTNYQNTISRAPTDAEKLAFLEALYSIGGELDLWRGGSFEGGPYVRYADPLLAEFIQNNQGMYLASEANKGSPIDGSGIENIVGQTGRPVTMAMVANAGATALKGVELVMAANQQTGLAQNRAHARAMQLIRNAGSTIRLTLQAHDARVAFQQSIVGAIFDQVWGMIPGGGQLVSAGVALLKMGLKQALTDSMSDSEPNAQAETIARKFTETTNALVTAGHLPSPDAQDAINGFEAVRR